MKRSILLCQEIHARSGVGPCVEAAVEDVGGVTLERSAGLSWGVAFGDLASEITLGLRMVALLHNGDAVESCVELAVAAAV